MTVVYCVGTATEVGKTWFGAATLAELRRRGRPVRARKPVQSFDPADDGPLDAEALAAATGESPDEVCPPERTYEVPMAPPMAAAALCRPCPSVAELVAAVAPAAELDLEAQGVEIRPSGPRERVGPGTSVSWVEGVGGPRSPIAADGDGIDLGAALRPDVVVLVADAGLGTINAVQLCLGPLRELGGEPIVVLNRYDDAKDLHRRNREWLADRLGLDVVTSPAALADRI